MGMEESYVECVCIPNLRLAEYDLKLDAGIYNDTSFVEYMWMVSLLY